MNDINEITDYNSNTNIDYTCESETLLFARKLRYDSTNDQIFLGVAGNEYLLLDDVQTFSLTANFKDLNYFAGGALEVESIEISFTVGEIERPFSARIFPRNMVDDPTS